MRLSWWSIPILWCGLTPVTAQQDFSWWNELHDWDGTSSWQQYLTLAPAFLGPNALPVPDIQNGALTPNTSLRIAGEAHFGDGDDTQNLFLELSLPLFSDRAALRLSYVPLEHYRIQEATRDRRAIRDFDGRGWASGDLYVGTDIQLTRAHHRLPDLLLTVNLRTASGTNLVGGRFTDTPGYFFDLSAGRTYALGTAVDSIRPYATAGFYVWQTYRDDYRQNDAFLYGIGADLYLGSTILRPAVGGYLGYTGAGDQPLVARLTVEQGQQRRTSAFLRIQHGFHDYPYSSLRVGMIRRWR